MTIIFPVACDIVKDGEALRLGFESICSCEKACEVARTLRPWSYFVMPSARQAPDTSVPMSELMKDHLIVNLGISWDSVHPLVAKTFSTEGEVLAIVEYLKSSPVHFDEIVICCKWWHMPRTWTLLKFHLWKAGIKIKVRTKCCRSKAKPQAILMEFIGAWPLNILRIGRRRWTTGQWSV